MADGQVIDKHFSPEELAALLTDAAMHLVKQCREVYCDPIPPEQFVFLVVRSDEREPSLPQRAYGALDAVRFLLRDDGEFRDWINMSPVGIRSDSTVIELSYASQFSHRLLVGPLATPFEPLQLRGRALPPNWSEGSPIPRVSLPVLDL